ncbi:hypothetical protein LIER_23075 [Lithospermum erythrorhizon]|uniref:Uncharacterized protein n=1 Tax=Lithospermum erythrorhizon TaxID=34254 RepID=A0AAV3R0C6_LITER
MASLGLGPQSSHEASRFWLYTQDLHEESARECLKVGALEQELRDLRGQVSNYPWDMALKDQEQRRAQAEHAANQATFDARQEREDLRRTYFQDNPQGCGCIGVVVLSDFFLNCQDRVPIISALAEEYK